MNRNDILKEIRQYFEIGELVCDHTLTRWGEAAWQFLDTDYLHTLLILRRDVIGRPMFCNNHEKGVHQRGLRCNCCDLVRSKSGVYLSAHCLGKAGDFTIKGMTAENARQRIKMLPGAFPAPIRIEAGVSWLHFDVLPQYNISQKVYEFNG